MKNIIFWGLLGLGIFQKSLAMTGLDYLESRKDGNDKLFDALVLAQIAGTLQAAKYANDWLKKKSESTYSELCILPAVSSEDSFGDFEIAVKIYINDHPNLLGNDLSELILWALIDSYPCN